MNIITHALLPVLLAAPVLPRSSPREFHVSVGIVAFAGALPDLVHPHLSLTARYASWSHSVFALAGFTLLFVLAGAFARKQVPLVAALLAPLACASHLLLDAVSGGIAWLYPVSPARIGLRLVRFEYWFPIDATLLFAGLGVLYWIQDRGWKNPAGSSFPAKRDPGLPSTT